MKLIDCYKQGLLKKTKPDLENAKRSIMQSRKTIDDAKNIKEKVICNFGCPNPEGYRKAIRKMKFAEKFGIAVVTLIESALPVAS